MSVMLSCGLHSRWVIAIQQPLSSGDAIENATAYSLASGPRGSKRPPDRVLAKSPKLSAGNDTALLPWLPDRSSKR